MLREARVYKKKNLGVFKLSSGFATRACMKVIAAVTAHQIIEKHEGKKSQILRLFVSQDLREFFMELHLLIFSSIRTTVMTILWS